MAKSSTRRPNLARSCSPKPCLTSTELPLLHGSAISCRLPRVNLILEDISIDSPPQGKQFFGFRATGDVGPFTVYTTKRNRCVWFRKTVPSKPASPLQRRQRSRFEMAAQAWERLGSPNRLLWRNAARRAGLFVNGPALWTWWQLSGDLSIIRTIERQSGITLLP